MLVLMAVFCPQPRPPGPRVSSHYSDRPPVSQGQSLYGDDDCRSEFYTLRLLSTDRGEIPFPHFFISAIDALVYGVLTAHAPTNQTETERSVFWFPGSHSEEAELTSHHLPGQRVGGRVASKLTVGSNKP